MNFDEIFKPWEFDLHPLPSKDPGVWPHFKNFALETGGNYLTDASQSWYEAGVNGILFSESMEFEGVALDGEFAFSVRLKKDGEAAVRVATPNFEKLFTCTGRDDATISLD